MRDARDTTTERARAGRGLSGEMVRPEGFLEVGWVEPVRGVEPLTYGLQDRRSDHLSYTGTGGVRLPAPVGSRMRGTRSGGTKPAGHGHGLAGGFCGQIGFTA